MQFLGLLLFSPFLIAWLLFCFLLAIPGWLLPIKKVEIDLDQVLEVETVCKVLNRKGLITDSEYDFETKRVAAAYDGLTFRGYLFIMAPVISLMKSTGFIDAFIHWLVKRWILVHRYFFDQEGRPPAAQIGLTRFCIGMAHSVGKSLRVIYIMTKMSLEI